VSHSIRKLNLTKSKYNTAQPPKSETETAEAQGDGSTKLSYEGVAADGSPFAFSFATNYDGKDSRFPEWDRMGKIPLPLSASTRTQPQQ